LSCDVHRQLLCISFRLFNLSNIFRVFALPRGRPVGLAMALFLGISRLLLCFGLHRVFFLHRHSAEIQARRLPARPCAFCSILHVPDSYENLSAFDSLVNWITSSGFPRDAPDHISSVQPLLTSGLEIAHVNTPSSSLPSPPFRGLLFQRLSETPRARFADFGPLAQNHDPPIKTSRSSDSFLLIQFSFSCA